MISDEVIFYGSRLDIVTDNLVDIGCHYISPQAWRTEHKHLTFSKQGTTLTDYCLRTRDMNVVDYLGVIS